MLGPEQTTITVGADLDGGTDRGIFYSLSLRVQNKVFFSSVVKKPVVILLGLGIAFVSMSVPTSVEVQMRVLVPVLCSLGSCF